MNHKLIVTAGAIASDVSSTLVTVPADAIFVDHYGDVDLMMVFREAPVTGRPERGYGTRFTTTPAGAVPHPRAEPRAHHFLRAKFQGRAAHAGRRQGCTGGNGQPAQRRAVGRGSAGACSVGLNRYQDCSGDLYR